MVPGGGVADGWIQFGVRLAEENESLPANPPPGRGWPGRIGCCWKGGGLACCWPEGGKLDAMVDR